MLPSKIKSSVRTPAFVYDEENILKSVSYIRNFSRKECKLLFPLKCFAITDGLRLLSPIVDGFSCSSLFEARLARDILGSEKSVHITTPALRDDEIEMISQLCDYISFNSVSQWERYYGKARENSSCGMRINPGLSFVRDERYNPCRKHSKLGVSLNDFREVWNHGGRICGVEGVHFHSNCESADFYQILQTVHHLDAHLAQILEQVDWVNLGGGYLFEKAQNPEKLIEAITLLKSSYDLDVFFEPGKAVVGRAGYLISSVIDIFESDGQRIAILDTTVNHAPEIFEYGYKPDIAQESEKGRYQYTLAGATCLAGDLFGEYRFEEPLEVGSRIVFEDMGSYTLTKAHMFNGVNLPAIYALTLAEKLELKKQFGYEDYKSKWG